MKLAEGIAIEAGAWELNEDTASGIDPALATKLARSDTGSPMNPEAALILIEAP